MLLSFCALDLGPLGLCMLRVVMVGDLNLLGL